MQVFVQGLFKTHDQGIKHIRRTPEGRGSHKRQMTCHWVEERVTMKRMNEEI